jgi:hypothetical protein
LTERLGKGRKVTAPNGYFENHSRKKPKKVGQLNLFELPMMDSAFYESATRRKLRYRVNAWAASGLSVALAFIRSFQSPNNDGSKMIRCRSTHPGSDRGYANEDRREKVTQRTRRRSVCSRNKRCFRCGRQRQLDRHTSTRSSRR